MGGHDNLMIRIFEDLKIGSTNKKIKFYGINSNVWIGRDLLKSKDVKIVVDEDRHFRKGKEMFYGIEYIETNLKIDKNDKKLEWYIGEALNVLCETMTKIAVKGRGICYIRYPIRCKIGKRKYIYSANGLLPINFHKKDTKLSANSYIEEFRGVNRLKDHHYFYRESQDYNYPIEYRFLNLWKFYENYYKKRGKDLVMHLNINHKRIFIMTGTIKNDKEVVDVYKKVAKKFYENSYKRYRNAIAHANKKPYFVPKKGNYIKGMVFYYKYLTSLAQEILGNIPVYKREYVRMNRREIVH